MRSSSEFRSPPKSSIPPCISVTNLLITSRHARSTSPRALSDVCPFGPDPRGGMYAATRSMLCPVLLAASLAVTHVGVRGRGW